LRNGANMQGGTKSHHDSGGIRWDCASLRPTLPSSATETVYPQYPATPSQMCQPGDYALPPHLPNTRQAIVGLSIAAVKRHRGVRSRLSSISTSEASGAVASKSMRPPKPVSSCRPINIHLSEGRRGAATIMSSKSCSLASDDSASRSGFSSIRTAWRREKKRRPNPRWVGPPGMARPGLLVARRWASFCPGG